jgi:hypothetical protein
MVRKVILSAVVVTGLMLGACNNATATAEGAPADKAAAVAASTFTPVAGAAVETLKPEPLDGEGEVGFLPGIVRYDVIPNQTGDGFARIIGTAGGDPAANGLMTYLVFSTVHAGEVLTIGNIIDYRIVGVSPGKVDLEIDQSKAADDGTLSTETRKVVLAWTVPADAEDNPDQSVGATVTVTPAQ